MIWFLDIIFWGFFFGLKTQSQASIKNRAEF